jgi:20S proteasome alpha/beta subunit
MRGLDERTLVAVRYRTCTVLLDIAKREARIRKLLHSGSGGSTQSLGYCSDNVSCLLVGDKADCERVRVLCSDFDSSSRSEEGEPLSAPRLALLLADEAQRRSMEATASRKLAVNALLIDTARRGGATAGDGSSREYGDIYIVDTSGNYVQTKAGSVGGRAERVAAWLGTRGRFLADRWQRRSSASSACSSTASDHSGTGLNDMRISESAESLSSTSGPSSTTAQDLSHSTSPGTPGSDSSLRACLDLAARCLQENFPNDALVAGNCSVTLAVYVGGERSR